ncbi:MAG: hypothetical protein RLZZ416_277 [Candidatus Parcubacteria bacterium]|jgi:CheY-like chemotaxis protein
MKAERKPTVLMLDDEKFLLTIYRLKFEKSGYQVSTYYSTDDALQVLRSGFTPDVILFDITMPDSRSGYEFIEAVQAERLAKRSLKLALTNEGQDAEKSRLADLGADAHLLKANYTPSELVAEVTKRMSAKNARSQRGRLLRDEIS